MKCTLCPRNCGIDREKAPGRCHSDGKIKVARAALHFWEEPPISGEGGSGTVFFSGCPLGCVYCQNMEISKGKVGKVIDLARLSEIFLELESKGAHNLNLVTATHYAPETVEAVKLARDRGLSLPIVWNTSGYENVETLELLRGTVDIFLTDFRYLKSSTAERYSSAPDYPEVAARATDKMLEIVGEPLYGEDGLLKRGVIMRQLILPCHIKEAMDITSFLYRRYGDRILYSIMNQFTPTSCLDSEKYPELCRKITDSEYERVIDHAANLGITEGFIQEGGTAEESFIPDFNCEGV